MEWGVKDLFTALGKKIWSIRYILKNPRRYGNPPYSVVVVHGGPGAAGEMAPVARELSTDFGVIEPIQTESSIEDQANELKIVVEKNCDSPITLIGFSWGAWLCYIFAAKNPVLVNKLILVSNGPFEEKYVSEIQKTRFSRLNKKEIAEVESLFEVLKNPSMKDKNPIFARFGILFSKADAYDPIKSESDKSEIDFQSEIFQSVWKEAAELRRSGALLKLGKQINCPVVAIHGEYDPHPADGVQKPLAAILLNFRFIILKNCGHKPWIERHAKEKFYSLLKAELI